MSTVGLELPKQTLQEIVILPTINPEVRVVHTVHSLAEGVWCVSLSLVIHWTEGPCQRSTSLWPSWKWQNNAGIYIAKIFTCLEYMSVEEVCVCQSTNS